MLHQPFLPSRWQRGEGIEHRCTSVAAQTNGAKNCIGIACLIQAQNEDNGEVSSGKYSFKIRPNNKTAENERKVHRESGATRINLIGSHFGTVRVGRERIAVYIHATIVVIRDQPSFNGS